MSNGRLNLQVQQLNSGSLQTSRDVYGYERTSKDLAPLERNPAAGSSKRLRSYGAAE